MIISSCTPQPEKDSKVSNESTVVTPQEDLASLEVEQFEFSNGLRLLVQEDRTSPVVSVQAWVPAGSITEGKYLGSGISHAVEHMLFKGTDRRGVSQIAEEVQSVGGYINAYTTFDRTVYYIESPSSGWKTALDVLADAIFHSKLPENEFIKEQEVIRREFAMGLDSPDRALSRILFSTAFVEHPYKQPVIGHMDLFNKLTRDDLYNYYQAHYVPNNVTFIIVGDVNAQEIKEALEEETSTLERGFVPDVFIPKEPRQLGRREHLKPFSTDVTRMIMAYPIPAITHPDLYPLDVLALIAGRGRSSRLYQELVEKKKLLRDVGASSYTPAHSGLWAVSATLLPKADTTPLNMSLKEIELEVTSILEEFKHTHVTENELQKAKRQVITSHAAELKTVSGKASSLGLSWFVARDIYFDENYLKGIKNVTAEDIQRAAKTYFTPNSLTLVSLYPREESTQDADEDKLVKEPSRKNIKKLNNGMPVVMIRDAKAPLVTIRATALGGLLAETQENNGIGQLMTRLLTKGTASRSASDLALEVEQLGGSIAAEFGNNSFSLAIEVLDSDLSQAIDILTDVLLNPTFPVDEIDKERDKLLTDIKLEIDNPVSLARNKLRASLFKPHPYGLSTLGNPESLAKLDQQTLKSYYRKLLAEDNLVFSLGGSFDEDLAIAELNKKLSSFQPSEPVSYKGRYKPDNPEYSKKHILPTDKVQAIVTIGFPSLSLDSPDRPALEIIDQALSGQASRLFTRIREEQSLAYFVGTGLLAGLDPGYFMYYAGTQKDKAEKVHTEIFREIKDINQSGFSPEQIERAKVQLLGKRILQDQAASTRSYKAALFYLYGLGADFEEKINQKIRDTTTEQVNEAFQKYFSQDNYISVIVQPDREL
ncbi:MAG: pitrilysin family protein [Verrucomicrobiota bacterium]